MAETSRPGPGRATADEAFSEVKKQVARRNEEAHKAARKVRAARSQAPATVVAPTPTTAAPPVSSAVRTDDLDTGLKQADDQLSQTGAAVRDADQNPQQNSD